MDAIALSITPAGHLVTLPAEAEEVGVDGVVGRRIAKAFEGGTGAGVLHLGSAEVSTLLPPAFAFFRELGRLFVVELLARPDVEDRRGETRAPAPLERFEELLRGVPPMRGAEYLTPEVIDGLWEVLHQAFSAAITGHDKSVQEFFAARSTAWSGVGRVHFHLAENKGDPEHPFAFMATFTTGLAPQGKAKHRMLGVAVKESSAAGDDDRLLALLLPLQRAAAASPFVQELVDSRAIFEPLAWTPREAHRLLQELPALEQSGVIVRVPNSWGAKRPPRPRVTLEVGTEPPAGVGLDALLAFSVQATLEGETLDEDDLRLLRESTDGLVFLKGRWVEVDRQRLGEVLSGWERVRAEAAEGVSLAEAMRMLAGVSEEVAEVDPAREWTGIVPGEWLGETLKALRADGLDAEPPPSFQATLRPYQRQGLAWLRFLTQLRLGACLADDMGLGKTVQVLALLQLLKERRGIPGPHLLVCPASLIANWRAEAERFAPGLRVFVAHGSAMPSKELAAMTPGAVDEFDLVITSYGSVPRLSWLSAREWGLVVLDEAQAIKNPAVRQTRAVKALRSVGRIALTGTPVENRVGDLWSLFDFLNPGLLGSAKQFTAFVKSTESFAPLRSLVRPYILRRLKTDPKVIQDLPGKTEVTAFCGLSRRQAALYQDTVSNLKKRLSEAGEGIERRGLVLATLLRLKQICNHPSHWLGDGAWTPADSGKFERLRELCETFAERQEKVLVFTQFREATKPLAQFLTGVFGRPGLVLSGETAVRQRQQLVKAFQEDERVPFFVLSLKAGGTGLNLTAASQVVHFDRWWNPAVENQATDRAFRIGQKKNVLVHKFVCRGTVEERIDELITAKLGMARELLEGNDELKLTELTDAELLDVVRLDVRTARGEG